ncbi:MAG: hypothetical protein U0414_04895 [Polyangiaceae bacterium]
MRRQKTDASASASASSNAASGSKGKTASCAFQKDPNNCWRKFVDSVKTCTGSADVTGEMSADGKSCKAKDVEVTFAKPMKKTPGKRDIDLTVKKGGTECLHWVVTGEAMDMEFGEKAEDTKTVGTKDDYVMTGTSPAGKVSVHAVGLGYELTCPDGTLWVDSLDRAISDGSNVDCADDGMHPYATANDGFGGKGASLEIAVQILSNQKWSLNCETP